MLRLTRAAGIAAALIAALIGTPSQAWEFNTPTPISSDLGTAAPDLEAALSADTPEAASAPSQIETAPLKSETPVRRSLSDLVGLHSSSKTADAEHECLANAVYFESKGEPLAGQLSVAKVIMNRAQSGRFASSLCGVVKQRGQFSFVRGGHLPTVPRASAAWMKAVAIAKIAQQDLATSPASRALFFHATRVRPSWRGLTRVATVGNHIFYR